MTSQRMSRRMMALAVLLIAGLAAFEARAQPPFDAPPPLPLGGPPIPGLPTDGPPAPPGVGPGMGSEGEGSHKPGPTPGGLFPPPGPPALPAGPRPGMGPGGAPGGAEPDINTALTGLREKLESALTYFNAFWLFAAVSLGLESLVLLVMLALLMKLARRSAAEGAQSR